MNAERINILSEQALQKMDDSDFEGALKLAYKIKGLGPHHLVSYTASGILIDVGTALGKKEIVKEGVDLLLKDLEQVVKHERLASTTFYNLANGYMTLFLFKKSRDPYVACFEETELDKAKAYYRKALEYKAEDLMRASKVWVNLGNCFDQIGRVVEALECYEEALKLKPDHGMALANKGVALSYYAGLAGEHQATFLIEAHSLLSQAFKLGVIPESVPSFKKYIEQIRDSFPDKQVLDKPPEYPGIQIEARSKFEKFLVEFCLKNKLYLNICNNCQKCSEAIGDPVVIRKMTVPIGKHNGIDFLEKDPYLQLSRYLNQIKQDYTTARFSIILSQYKGLNLDFVDKRVKIIDTLDYSMHNIYIQLVKSSFKSLYDILDKIACFINEYLKLGIPEKKIDFRRVWFSDLKTKTIHEKITVTKNYSLNALFDLYQDFEKGPYRTLRDTRNALTHRFVNVRMFQEKENAENMIEETLLDKTLELAKITRNAIIYLLQFVYVEETKKESGPKRPLLPMIARELPDNLKSYR